MPSGMDEQVGLLVESTACTKDMARLALKQADNDIERAAVLILEGNVVGGDDPSAEAGAKGDTENDEEIAKMVQKIDEEIDKANAKNDDALAESMDPWKEAENEWDQTETRELK